MANIEFDAKPAQAMTEGKELRQEPQFWASSDYVNFEDDDPRAVSARAEKAYRHSLAGRLEAVANPTKNVSMIEGRTYDVS